MKRILLLVAAILVASVAVHAAWKFNPHTGKLDYYEAGSLADNSVTAAKLATDNTGTFNFGGPVSTPDPGDGSRRISMRSNSMYTCAVSENSVLIHSGRLAYCDNGTLKSFTIDNTYNAVPTYVAQDLFNRANENPLSDGGKWSTPAGLDNMVVDNNAATTVLASGDDYIAIRTSETFADDQYSQFTITGNTATTSYLAGCVRWTDNNGYCVQYKTGVEAGAGYFRFDRFANGVRTVVNEKTTPYPLPNPMRVEASGTTIRVLDGTTERATWTDATYSSGKPGIHKYSGDATIDDWVGGNL